MRTFDQAKGHREAVRAIVDAVAAGDPSPFSLAEIVAVSGATFAIEESLRSGAVVPLPFDHRPSVEAARGSSRST